MYVSTVRISIITAVYNGVEHLEQTIKSVLNQGIPGIEYIIIDGGSTDGSIEIIEKYSGSLAYWSSEPDTGIYDAMNKGLARATGDIIGIQSSDDWYEPGCFLHIAVEYAKDREVILYGIQRVHDSRGEREIRSYPHERLGERMIPHSTCFVPRSVYGRLGGFDTSLRIAADYDFMLKAQSQGVRFVQLERVLSNIRRGGISTRHVALTRYETALVRSRYGFSSPEEMAREELKYRLSRGASAIRGLFSR